MKAIGIGTVVNKSLCLRLYLFNIAEVVVECC